MKIAMLAVAVIVISWAALTTVRVIANLYAWWNN